MTVLSRSLERTVKSLDRTADLMSRSGLVGYEKKIRGMRDQLDHFRKVRKIRAQGVLKNRPA